MSDIEFIPNVEYDKSITIDVDGISHKRRYVKHFCELSECTNIITPKYIIGKKSGIKEPESNGTQARRKYCTEEHTAEAKYAKRRAHAKGNKSVKLVTKLSKKDQMIDKFLGVGNRSQK